MINAILLASSQTEPNFCKGCKNVACPDRAYRAAAAHRAEPVAAGLGEPARHLGELSEPDRARSAGGERHIADQARRDLPTRPRHAFGLAGTPAREPASRGFFPSPAVRRCGARS